MGRGFHQGLSLFLRFGLRIDDVRDHFRSGVRKHHVFSRDTLSGFCDGDYMGASFCAPFLWCASTGLRYLSGRRGGRNGRHSSGSSERDLFE